MAFFTVFILLTNVVWKRDKQKSNSKYYETDIESWARFRKMPGLGDVMDCAELVVDSVTVHDCGNTDGGGGLWKFNATIVGVWPPTVTEPS